MLTKYIEWARRVLQELGFTDLIEQEPWQVDILILFVGVGVIGSLLTGLWRLWLWWYRKRQQIRLAKDLHPFFSSRDIKQATRYYVATHFQSNPPSQQAEPRHARQVTARQKLIPFFLNHAFKADNDQQRFYIVLAGSGMGKTTFMLNLYLAYLRRKQIGRAPFHIKLMPLGYPDLLKRIDAIEAQETTILLLDGLDEDTQAIRNYKRRLERILDKVKDFRFVVFTCRTQFFPSEEEEPRETGVLRFGTKQGFQVFAKLYLSPFDDKDIAQYLGQRYGRWRRARKAKALRVVSQAPNLVVRPMLLSYIDDLVAAGADEYHFLSDLYRDLIQKWIEREADRVQEGRREQFRDELFRFSREVALNIYKHRRHRKGLFIGLRDIQRLGDSHDIQLEEIEMQSRSLLNRNALDQFKFAHKSILEYLLAREAVENLRFAQQLNFQSMDQANIFYREMCLTQRTVPWLARHDSGIEVRYAGQAEYEPSSLVAAELLPKLSALKSQQLSDLTLIAPLEQLEQLDLSHSPVQQLHALRGMGQLYELYLSYSQVSDLSPLENLLYLEVLTLAGTPIHEIGPLKKLENLISLDLSHTQARPLELLQHLTQLQELRLAHTRLKDLTPLRSLVQLLHLDLGHTAVSGLNPIRDLRALQHLDLSHTSVKNLSPLRNLRQLRSLDLTGIPATNYNALKQLDQLQTLRLSAGAVTPENQQALQADLAPCAIEWVE